MIYIDSTYNCHPEDDGTRRAFEVPYFDGKCVEYIEGHKYIPDGEKLVLDSGLILEGEAITTTGDYSLLMVAQSKYERQLIADMRQALEIMEVTV